MHLKTSEIVQEGKASKLIPLSTPSLSSFSVRLPKTRLKGTKLSGFGIRTLGRQKRPPKRGINKKFHSALVLICVKIDKIVGTVPANFFMSLVV
jgi:hypothetical protein